MPIQIAFQVAVYTGILSQLNAGVQNIEPSINDIPEIVSKAETMICYRTRLDRIRRLLEQYSALLEKDSASLQSVGINMVALDAALGNQFRR
jgi:type VII secretion effector (TIGR04197 family)